MATSPWLGTMSPSLVEGLFCHWTGTATTVANVPLRMTTVLGLPPWPPSARLARAFFSNMMRSPTANVLPEASRISAPSSSASRRRSLAMEFRSATSVRVTARIAVVASSCTLHHRSISAWRAEDA